MELTILNHEYEDIFIIDDYQSLIWTERYQSPGDFELYTSINETILKCFHLIIKSMNQKLDTFAWSSDSDTMMCIDVAKIKGDLEEGSKVTLTGSSLASILGRRIVWEQTVLDGYLEGQVEKLLNQNAISPTIEDRKIPDLIFVPSEDERIAQMKIRAQFTGDNLLDAIEKICKSYSIGFRMWLTNENKLAFQLYMGEDRSYDQKKNPEVIFSAEFDNLTNTNYLESMSNLKNVALVAGEDQAQNRKIKVVGNASGLQRRELYVDARDIQSTDEEGNVIPDDIYYSQLEQRGQEQMTDYTYVKAFDGEFETNQTFIYGRDFFKGDVVQLSNEYGIEGKVRILEIIRSFDNTGYKIYPTFEVVENEEEEDQS